ncbi:MAG: DUF3613 domain-containing protein [Sideroxydans sp.]|nr:DUF3613 domain-containing protein [Sideroxyarcus sp.]
MNCDTMRYSCIILSLWIGFSPSATAAEAEHGSSSRRAQPAVGARTTQWLDMQREGRAAGNLLPIPGAEAGPSYQRYIDSFATPIPDQLSSQSPAYGARK